MKAQAGILPGNGQEWGFNAQRYLEDMFLDSEVIPQKSGNRGKKRDKQILYRNILSAFDIETTTLDGIDQSIMYIWQWCFMSLYDERIITIYGRTWESWQDCAAFLCSYIPDRQAIVVLDHNLSYEFQFLREYVRFDADSVFATDTREVVKATVYGKLEFRCTMRHSNTSLKHYLDQWHTTHKKLSGDDFDYNKSRYPWTPLTYGEMLYALHDVIGLCEAYRAELEYWHDDLYSVPMTSTGYVRRICKRAWARVNYYDRISWIPDLALIDEMRLAFRGGDTHASRFHATPEEMIFPILVPVESWDRASSYPDVLVNCPYPLGEWYEWQKKKDEWTDRAEIDKLVDKYEKAVLTRVHFKGLRLADEGWEMPYIPKDKALYYDGICTDNGRILSADYLSMCITDVDWRVIRKEYAWDHVYFSDTKYCRYKYLPAAFTDVVKQFYTDKTVLKGSPEGSPEETDYTLKKQLLNALYGMAAQWPIKESVILTESGEWIPETENIIRKREQETGKPLTDKQKKQIIDECRKEKWTHYKKKAFVPYQVGVWCTAWARLELHRAMYTVKEQGGRVIYCDTDSVKFIGKVDMTVLNEFYKNRSLQNGAYADNHAGKRYYMGVYDYEYKAVFATMGAKKYCYRRLGEAGYHVTIAGVNKVKGAMELMKLGGVSAFHAGTVFKAAGGVQGIYNDKPYGVYRVGEHEIYIGSNVCLKPDTYTLGLSGDYARLLDSIAVRRKIDEWTGLGGSEE